MSDVFESNTNTRVQKGQPNYRVGRQRAVGLLRGGGDAVAPVAVMAADAEVKKLEVVFFQHCL